MPKKRWRIQDLEGHTRVPTFGAGMKRRTFPIINLLLLSPSHAFLSKVLTTCFLQITKQSLSSGRRKEKYLIEQQLFEWMFWVVVVAKGRKLPLLSFLSLPWSTFEKQGESVFFSSHFLYPKPPTASLDRGTISDRYLTRHRRGSQLLFLFLPIVWRGYHAFASPPPPVFCLTQASCVRTHVRSLGCGRRLGGGDLFMPRCVRASSTTNPSSPPPQSCRDDVWYYKHGT